MSSPCVTTSYALSPPPSVLRLRSMDRVTIHSDQVEFSRLTQEHPKHLPADPQSQATPSSSSQSSLRHLSDSAALSYQQWDRKEQGKDREHPLTSLEIALAEVQRCASTDDGVLSSTTHGSNSFADDSQGPARSLSVLEKVSRFERRERAGKQRSHSTSHVHNKATHLHVSLIKLNSCLHPLVFFLIYLFGLLVMKEH